MNEKNNMNNIRYVFILIGVLALLASYFLVFNKYNTKIDDISSEIDTLQTNRDRLKEMDANKGNIQSETDRLNKEAETEFTKYDGGLSYKAEIMDTYNMTQNLDIKVERLSMSPATAGYEFGQIASSNPNGSSGDMTKYTSEQMAYSLSAKGTYAQMKQIIKYIMDTKGKRKTINAISMSGVGDELTMELSLTEYAITGEGREAAKVEIPDYLKATSNPFLNEVIVRTAE